MQQTATRAWAAAASLSLPTLQAASERSRGDGLAQTLAQQQVGICAFLHGHVADNARAVWHSFCMLQPCRCQPHRTLTHFGARCNPQADAAQQQQGLQAELQRLQQLLQARASEWKAKDALHVRPAPGARVPDCMHVHDCMLTPRSPAAPACRRLSCLVLSARWRALSAR